MEVYLREEDPQVAMPRNAAVREPAYTDHLRLPQQFGLEGGAMGVGVGVDENTIPRLG
jgi:hypothetical protein